jgi:hypothetical protein
VSAAAGAAAPVFRGPPPPAAPGRPLSPRPQPHFPSPAHARSPPGTATRARFFPSTRPPPLSSPDIDECTATGADAHKCDARAACTNVRGNYTCACRGELGFAGSGFACDDVRPPTITLGALSVSATAPADASTAAATFPAWALADNLTPLADITVACTANLTGGASADQVTSGAAQFPVGTTPVSCVATDGAGNVSPPAAFSVVVACGAGLEFRGGKCTGETFEFPLIRDAHGAQPGAV